MKKSNLLSSTSDKVLAYDMQILFGKNMRTSEVIEELLPRNTVATEDTQMENTSSLESLDSWLEGLINNG